MSKSKDETMKGAKLKNVKKECYKMNKREQDEFLLKVKKSLMIPAEDTYADDEISLHINACEVLLSTVGVPSSVCGSDNALVEGLILIYVKTYFGFKNDGSVKELPTAFEMLLKQLALTCKEGN